MAGAGASSLAAPFFPFFFFAGFSFASSFGASLPFFASFAGFSFFSFGGFSSCFDRIYVADFSFFSEARISSLKQPKILQQFEKPLSFSPKADKLGI